MSNKDLHLHPHKPRRRPGVWWYEDAKGLEFLVEQDWGGPVKRFRVPWSALRSAVARKDKR